MSEISVTSRSVLLSFLVNSEEFIQLKQDEVREDEMFFYK